MRSHNEIPNWILQEIGLGLDKLLSLSLDGHPAHDTAGKTVVVWAEAICDRRVFDEVQDRPRFRAAFRTLMQRESRWPSPAKFLDALPSNVVPFQKLPKLEDEKRRRAGLEAIANINKIIGYRAPREDDNGPEAA
jgi:hypothetical protein